MNTCGSISPNMMGCTRLSDHERVGILSCKNVSSGQEWCGYCIAWSCTIHGILGQETRTLMAFELDRLYQLPQEVP